MKLRILICMHISAYTLHAADHEVPEVLQQAGFSHIDFIPSKLVEQLSLLKNENDWLNYYINHPVNKYHYDDKSVKRMDKVFEEIGGVLRNV